MKALVTGGGGFLGQAIVRQLRQRGDQVRSLSRSHYAELERLGVQQYCGDVSDAAAVAEAVREVDMVFHVAAKAGIWGKYQDYFNVNVRGTRNILNACRSHGVRRLVYTSTPSVVHTGKDLDGVDESTPIPRHFEAHYPATKAIAEGEVLAANDCNLATVALRPHLIWGPGDNHLLPRLLQRVNAGKFRLIAGGANMIDVTYVDNAAMAHLQAADCLQPGAACAGRAYFLSQGQPIRMCDFVNRLLAAAGLPPVTKSIPYCVALPAAGLLELFHTALGLSGEPRLTRFVVRQFATAHWFDISAAKRDLGYVPRVSTDVGMQNLRASLRSSS